MSDGTALRTVALVPYPPCHAPGQRYRIEQWAPHLLSLGVEVTLFPFLSPRGMATLHGAGNLTLKALETGRGYLRRASQLLRLGAYDVAYVYRELALLAPAWLEAGLSRRRPFVFDFDDAIYLPAASRANAWAAALKSPRKTAALCRLGAHVTVGNESLATYARPLARSVTVIPSTIDTEHYVVRDRPANPRPIVGWTGSVTTIPHLEALAPVLSNLRGLLPYDLRVIGGMPVLPNVEVQTLPGRAETEVEDLRPLDVGLMPLPDDEWSRGKCGMKALQYMALGIPPVVSPVGVNAVIVRDGVNGFHARNDNEWIGKLLLLLRDPELRRRLGAEARRTVEEGYSARVQAPRMAQVLREAARCRDA
jgi:glycosyltransferase involved in cell wall biosynthesis